MAPFAADIDISEYGSVQYTLNEGFSYSSYKSVSEFIGEQTGNKKFYGTSMIVAERNEVPKYDALVSYYMEHLYASIWNHFLYQPLECS